VQEVFGRVPPEGEQWVAEKTGQAVSHVREVVSFYTLYHTGPVGKQHIQLCVSTPCMLRGARNVLAQMEERFGIGPGQTTPDGKVTLSTVECLCACEAAPCAQVNDHYVGPLAGDKLQEILDSVRRTETVRRTELDLGADPGYVSTDGPVLSKRFKNAGGAWFDAYAADGGYQAAKKALGMTPQQIIDEVIKANLRGLGGAGFPTGKKWSFIPKDSPKPKFLVVNADEGEPGTFKDRYILERDPHALIEGILIAAFAIGSHKSYVYIRGEYDRSFDRFSKAVQEAYAKGWLGQNIQGSGFDLELVVHKGAGAYICGEETALLSSLEGSKGFPKLKPPFRPSPACSSARRSSTTWRRWPAFRRS